MKEILVAGMDTTDNSIIRFVTDYGYKAVHVSHTPNTPLPKCRAAIIAATNISHDLMWRVKKEYGEHQKPIFYANNGISSMKQGWEDVMVKPVTETLDKLNKREKVLYLLGFFFKRGEKVLITNFSEIVNKYTEISTGYMSVIFADLSSDKDGPLSKPTGTGTKGRYIWNGLTKDDFRVMVEKRQVTIPENWLQEQKLLTAKEVTTAMVTEAVKATAPTGQVPLTPAPEAKPVQASAEWESKMEAKLDGFIRQVGAQMAGLTRQVDMVSKSFNPQSREGIIREINDRLNKMSALDLLKMKTMFDIWMKD